MFREKKYFLKFKNHKLHRAIHFESSPDPLIKVICSLRCLIDCLINTLYDICTEVYGITYSSLSDCGEGNQVKLSKRSVPVSPISQKLSFISPGRILKIRIYELLRGIYIQFFFWGGGYWFAWEKYYDVIKENRIYKGEEVEKRGKRGNLHCTCGKNIIFEKKGGGDKISHFG